MQAGSTFLEAGFTRAKNMANIVSLIILNTNLSAAGRGIITWIKYKKADISITFNGTLDGLVGITAGVLFYVLLEQLS